MLIELWPAKGGVGTSTIAATIAAGLPQAGETAHILTRTRTEIADQCAIFGVPMIHDDRFDKPVELIELPREEALHSFRVFISSTFFPQWYPDPDGESFDHTIVVRTPSMSAGKSMFGDTVDAFKILVLENSYLALSRVAASRNKYDAAVCMSYPGAPLTMKDVAAVVELPVNKVVEWPRDAAVHRAIDAGLYVGRLHRINYKHIEPLMALINTGRTSNASNS